MALLHFVEMAVENPGAKPSQRAASLVSWKQIGSVSARWPSQRFVSGSRPPRSLGELIDLTRKAYPEVFRHGSTRATPRSTASSITSRWIRSTRYEMLRGFRYRPLSPQPQLLIYKLYPHTSARRCLANTASRATMAVRRWWARQGWRGDPRSSPMPAIAALGFKRAQGPAPLPVPKPEAAPGFPHRR